MAARRARLREKPPRHRGTDPIRWLPIATAHIGRFSRCGGRRCLQFAFHAPQMLTLQVAGRALTGFPMVHSGGRLLGAAGRC
jgi:hypothetical protein